MTNDKKIKIDKFKIFFKQSLAKDGETADLKVTFNNDFKDIIKNCCIDEETEASFGFCITPSKNTNRYKVKKIVFSGLYGSETRDLLFLKVLVDKGEYTFNFDELKYLECFKDSFKENVYRLLKIYLSSEIEQTIVYKVNLE